MSEIEKMYENIGIKADRIVCYRGFDNCMDNDFNCHCHNEKPCKDAAKIYPPFTAEKQIAILQLLTQRCDLTISHFTEWEFIHYDGQEPTQVTGEDFAETFAELINAYWQSFTEEEKQQVKGILE